MYLIVKDSDFAQMHTMNTILHYTIGTVYTIDTPRVGTIFTIDTPRAGTVYTSDTPSIGTVYTSDTPSVGTVYTSDTPSVGTVYTVDTPSIGTGYTIDTPSINDSQMRHRVSVSPRNSLVSQGGCTIFTRGYTIETQVFEVQKVDTINQLGDLFIYL